MLFSTFLMLCFVTCVLSKEIIESITKERQSFIKRWFLNDLTYTEDINIKTYLINKKNLKNILENPNAEIVQSTINELKDNELVFVLKITNICPGIGKLVFKEECDCSWKKLDVDFRNFTKGSNYIYVTPVKYKFYYYRDSSCLPEDSVIKWIFFYPEKKYKDKKPHKRKFTWESFYLK